MSKAARKQKQGKKNAKVTRSGDLVEFPIRTPDPKGCYLLGIRKGRLVLVGHPAPKAADGEGK